MKALVKRNSAPGLWLEEVPEPKPGLNDVLIKIDRTGICGTDLHIYKWDAWAQKTIPVPMVVGHEFVGEIVEVGANVADFHPGDIVSGEGHVVCGRCRNCLAGRRHLCAHTKGVGVNRPGAFAEYVAVPHDHNLARLPDGMSPVLAAGLGCRVTTAWHALTGRAALKAGEWLAVHGTGGIGLLTLSSVAPWARGLLWSISSPRSSRMR